MPTSWFACSTNGSTFAKPELICSPRPATPTARDCIHIWKARRVLGSNVERIASSVTDGSTWAAASRPSSGR